MDYKSKVLSLVSLHSGLAPDQIQQESVFGSNGLEGDDADEFLEAFADAFGVDL